MLAEDGVHFPDPFPRETRDDMGREECAPLDFGELSPPPLFDRLEQSLEDLSAADDLFDRPVSPLVLLEEDPGTEQPIGESDVLCLQSLTLFSLW